MKNNYSRYRNSKRSAGFTLAELLIVVAIIAVLVCIAIPVFSKQVYNAQAAVCQANRRELILNYKLDYMLNGGNESSAETLSAALTELGISGAQASLSQTSYAITGLCRNGGTVTAVCGANGSISTVCDKHPDTATDVSGFALQSSGFNAAVRKWISEKGTIKDKSGFFAEYYADNGAIAMTDEYKAMLNAEGLNHTLKNGQLYWWTYPVTDGSGNLLYSVTYANAQSDSAMWTNSSRGKMNPGYVVIVNGKTYIRSESGRTVEPGNSVLKYPTEDALEAALIENSYKLLP